jgi:hypothetical protein
MQRRIVQVMQVRMRDVIPGDVVNKHLSEPRGWVEVIETQDLPNNAIVLLAESDRDSINGLLNDIVAVQLTKVVEIPDTPTAAAA